MESLKQDVNGEKNRVLNISPANENSNNMTTNIYTQKEVEALYNRRLHQIISCIVLLVVLIVLILTCMLLVKVGYLDNELQNIEYKLDFT